MSRDISEATLRRLRAFAENERLTRQTAAALVGGLFDSDEEAVRALDGLLATGRYAGKDRGVRQLDGEVRELAEQTRGLLAKVGEL